MVSVVMARGSATSSRSGSSTGASSRRNERTRSRLEQEPPQGRVRRWGRRVQVGHRDLRPAVRAVVLDPEVRVPVRLAVAGEVQGEPVRRRALPPRLRVVQPDLPPGGGPGQRPRPVGQPALAQPGGDGQELLPAPPHRPSRRRSRRTGRRPGTGSARTAATGTASRRSRTGRRSRAPTPTAARPARRPRAAMSVELVRHHRPQQPAPPIGRGDGDQGDRRDRHRAAGHDHRLGVRAGAGDPTPVDGEAEVALRLEHRPVRCPVLGLVVGVEPAQHGREVLVGPVGGDGGQGQLGQMRWRGRGHRPIPGCGSQHHMRCWLRTNSV